jgi:hypothetical protein
MRFKKIIDNEDSNSTLFIIDEETGETTVTIKGSVIMKIVEDMGEVSAQAAIAAMVQEVYPELTHDEIKEIFA